MAEETKYTAVTGIAQISTANRKLDGTGTLGTLLTGASHGTLVKTLSIKATGSTTRGMIRFFVVKGESSYLLMEVDVLPINPTGDTPAFEIQIPINFTLQEECVLKVSTQRAEAFNVFAEGMNWGYNSSSVRSDTTEFYANTSSGRLTTANSNLTDGGSIESVYTAGSSSTYNGSSIGSFTVKGVQNVTPGMIRFFIGDTENKYLFTELIVDTVTYSGVDRSYEAIISFPDDFDLQAGYGIYASTENSEDFYVTTMGADFKYAS